MVCDEQLGVSKCGMHTDMVAVWRMRFKKKEKKPK